MKSFKTIKDIVVLTISTILLGAFILSALYCVSGVFDLINYLNSL